MLVFCRSCRSFVVLGLSVLCACQAHTGYQYSPTASTVETSGVHMEDTADTIQTEHEDRINRLLRLSSQFGAPVPTFSDNLVLPAGAIKGIAHATPVTRISYADTGVVFFDTDQDTLRPEALLILDALAETIKRDMPDTQITILGHTDSTGGSFYNESLSKRRALSVMKELVRRGIHPTQLSTVGIGDRLPAADNATLDGRARNRRAEFIISRHLEANIHFIEAAPYHPEWIHRSNIASEELSKSKTDPLSPAEETLTHVKKISVEKLDPRGGNETLTPSGRYVLLKPKNFSPELLKPKLGYERLTPQPKTAPTT